MRFSVAIVLALLTPTAALPASATMKPVRPNVVLFLVDDMGWMDCGAYGSKYYETPNIDRFATRAMRFTNAYAQPLCSPTRASILTGQYSARHQITAPSGHLPPQAPGHRFLPDSGPPTAAMLVPESKNYLEPSQKTLAETLQAAGYRTAHIGKWHLGTTEPHWPERQGFEVAFHCHPDPGPPGGYFSPYQVVPPGAEKPKPAGGRIGTITDGPAGEYIVDRQAAEAVKFIQASKDQPFFLNLWCYGVHGPWGHKEEYTRAFANKKDPTGRQGNPIMASMLRSVDECFGRIVDELKRQGLADNTMVIFYSDNGGNTHSNTTAEGKKSANTDWQKWAGLQPPTSNAPLRDGKGTLYEGGTRVPLMWSWAGTIPAGSTSEAVVGPIDIYPTIIDLLGLVKPDGQTFDGVSYASVLKGTGALNRTAYFNYHPHAGANRAGGVWVRSGDFKLIHWFGNPHSYELYNLRKDIGEATNLAEGMPRKVKELDALIEGFLRETGATYPRPNPAYRPAAAAGQDSAAALDAWKQRGCTATIADGVLTMKGIGVAGTAFLGHAAGSLSAPATVTLRVRSEVGGAGRIDRLTQGTGKPDEKVSIPFDVPKQGWQSIKVELKHVGRIGVLRLYLPVHEQPIEIDQIDIEPAQGKPEHWTF
ncbi:MAG: sulfatase [Planctomycetaceae bacterium]|nr:sulfatase [Planctomycetaceae bacterium]